MRLLRQFVGIHSHIRFVSSNIYANCFLEALDSHAPSKTTTAQLTASFGGTSSPAASAPAQSSCRPSHVPILILFHVDFLSAAALAEVATADDAAAKAQKD